jgi:hypothetical protein
MNRAASLIALLASLAGCSTGPRVRAEVTRGEAATALSIRLSSSDSSLAPVPIDLVQVNVKHSPKPGGVGPMLWAVTLQPGKPALRLPALIPYGAVPSGYEANGPAPALPIGEYEVRVNAGGVWSVTSFKVTPLNVIE